MEHTVLPGLESSKTDTESASTQQEAQVDEGSPGAVKREFEEDTNETAAQEPSQKRQRTEKGEDEVKEEPKKKKKSKSKASKQTGLDAAKEDGLADLKRGLLFITASPATSDFSDIIFNNAKELYNALFEPTSNPSAAPTSPLASSSLVPEPETSTNKHTDLPPPFALPDPANFLKGPSPALVRLNHIAPPTSTFASVPPIVNHTSTTSLHQPDSAQLPVLPDITDLMLCNAPFTHTSVLAQFVTPTNNNTYEPLEFLGDAYLEVIATRLIHSRFPNHSVGQKAGLRELLVKNETLAEYSTAYGFPDRVRTAIVQRTGPTWTKILADVFEAYLACVIIQDNTERGFTAAEKWLTELWAPKIVQWQRKGDGQRDLTGSITQKLDAKAELNKQLGGKESKLEYKETRPMELMKEGNRTIFFIGVFFTGFGYDNYLLGSGEGRSKQIASTIAATNALQQSADIIRVAAARKMEHERQFKSKAGFRGGRGGHSRGGHGHGHRGGFNNHNNHNNPNPPMPHPHGMTHGVPHGGFGGRGPGAPY
ncbi:hypothetical protein E2P81_ATG06520 [Venturia nashicola]|uniref:Uncharacterized protein n=1 Tax=Venturia nashicola TaxID=86259 RepID=A0A4Z1NT26_9PEZI|nr:hypothetical protein E6O75_ATG06688 [Venturia nashicola]TLD29867.1 hypothetical protein E2P81_ATG06520 [Venturia nashicola]